MHITAINVFIEADGKQHIALIDPEMSDMFVGMLGAFQKGQRDGVTLVPLQDDAAEHLLNVRRALWRELTKKGSKA